MVSGTISLISSDTLLFQYGNATYVCIVTLYPATLLNSLMRPHSFLVASLGLSMYSTMPSANSDSFTSSFPVWILFISFSSLIDMARISKTMLNKNNEGNRCIGKIP